MAVNELATRQSDVVICGGADAMNDIFMFLCFSKTPALSKSGDCRPFSDQADGTMLGEGFGMVALKRLDAMGAAWKLMLPVQPLKGKWQRPDLRNHRKLLVVDAGVLYKRRGIGMFVAEGARAALIAERRTTFRDDFLRPLLAEARALGISAEELADMIRKDPPP